MISIVNVDFIIRTNLNYLMALPRDAMGLSVVYDCVIS